MSNAKFASRVLLLLGVMSLSLSSVANSLLACEAKYEISGEFIHQVKISFRSQDQIFDYLQNRANKGLTSVMIHEVEKVPPSNQSKSNILVLRQRCRLVSDPWKEKLDIDVSVRPNTGNVHSYVVDKKSLNRESLNACFVGRTSDLNVGDQIKVTTALDQPSDAQIGRTKEWLAQHGIGGQQSGFFGRTVASMINFKSGLGFQSDCMVQK
jgi:hypothetical protein